ERARPYPHVENPQPRRVPVPAEQPVPDLLRGAAEGRPEHRLRIEVVTGGDDFVILALDRQGLHDEVFFPGRRLAGRFGGDRERVVTLCATAPRIDAEPWSLSMCKVIVMNRS